MHVKFTCIDKMRHCPTKIKDRTSCVPALAKMTYLVHADASLYPDEASKLYPGKYHRKHAVIRWICFIANCRLSFQRFFLYTSFTCQVVIRWICFISNCCLIFQWIYIHPSSCPWHELKTKLIVQMKMQPFVAKFIASTFGHIFNN